MLPFGAECSDPMVPAVCTHKNAAEMALLPKNLPGLLALELVGEGDRRRPNSMSLGSRGKRLEFRLPFHDKARILLLLIASIS